MHIHAAAEMADLAVVAVVGGDSAMVVMVLNAGQHSGRGGQPTLLDDARPGRTCGVKVIVQRPVALFAPVRASAVAPRSRGRSPRWQLTGHETLAGLAQVLRTLPDPDDPVITRAFMLTATNDELDGLSPKQWLEQVGAVARVTALIISLRHS